MNFSSLFVIALALAGAAKVNAAQVSKSKELFAILDEFLALVPDDKLNAIFIEYLLTDPEFQALLEYFKTDEFKDLVQRVNSIDEVIAVYDYLEEVGLDVYELVNSLLDYVGLPHLTPGKRATRSVVKSGITGGAAGFIADFQAILPLDEIKALHQKKLETSPTFAQFFADLKSPRFQLLVAKLLANEDFQAALRTAKQVGIDVKAIVEFYATLLGLNSSTSQTH